MRFFKKRVRVARNSDTVSARIASLILTKQRQLADYLNARCAGFSLRFRIGLLIGFCMLIGTYLIYVLISAFTN